MATFTVNPPDGEAVEMFPEDEEASTLLADALQKMDGLIGDYSPPKPPPPLEEPLAPSIVSCCEQLRDLVAEFVRRTGEGEGEEDPRGDIPQQTKELLVNWLTNKNMDSLDQAGQLQKDKDELLKQVVALQEQLETLSKEKEKLSKQVPDLERRVIEKEQQVRSLTEELRTTRASLQTREAERRVLREQQMSPIMRSHLQSPPIRKTVTLMSPPAVQPGPKRRSFRRSLAKAFGRRKAHTATLQSPGTKNISPDPPNPRAAAFYAMKGPQLAEWFQSIGLDMYSDIVEEGLSSGEKLASIVANQANEELVRIGILSTMHCKKISLAVESALEEYPSPLEDIDHKWVAEWLKAIGLPQYQRTFLDGRIDGRMLNFIALEDLKLVDMTNPFFIASLKRGIQAFRLCGYNCDYLREPAASRGSQKLLHWSAQDVMDWLQSIELEEYIEGFEKMGIHGAFMLLDVQFTSDTLAKALGIGDNKMLIRKHLEKKFIEIIGPVGAQKKIDAMQSKAFQPLDPTEQPRGGHRSRSQSLGSRRGRQGTEELLCPLEKFPVSVCVEPVGCGYRDTRSASPLAMDVPTSSELPPTP